jgi:hypothetical protein
VFFDAMTLLTVWIWERRLELDTVNFIRYAISRVKKFKDSIFPQKEEGSPLLFFLDGVHFVREGVGTIRGGPVTTSPKPVEQGEEEEQDERGLDVEHLPESFALEDLDLVEHAQFDLARA